ncbi:hypothetical protein HPB50_018236 [Hyalomma asiaticum]|uniref:Uncharacterized protein n=1 Tax=Hyalomma asiaticum TaxID=266040 RepID=A0ACB7SPD5_HYAAI|nr:hypothetical protein HPB50_018236 [Hyalomma asiaticum]
MARDSEHATADPRYDERSARAVEVGGDDIALKARAQPRGACPGGADRTHLIQCGRGSRQQPPNPAVCVSQSLPGLAGRRSQGHGRQRRGLGSLPAIRDQRQLRETEEKGKGG